MSGAQTQNELNTLFSDMDATNFITPAIMRLLIASVPCLFANAAQLRMFTGVIGAEALLQGISLPGDGLNGVFAWASGTFSDDNLNTIVPTTAAGVGAWIRQSTATQSNSNFSTFFSAWVLSLPASPGASGTMYRQVVAGGQVPSRVP